MAEAETKKTAALSALQKIRDRVKPVRESPDVPKEDATEEEYRGFGSATILNDAWCRCSFRDMPAEKGRRYLKKHGFAREQESVVGSVRGKTTRDIM